MRRAAAAAALAAVVACGDAGSGGDDDATGWDDTIPADRFPFAELRVLAATAASPTSVRVDFNRPVDLATATPDRFTFEPALAVHAAYAAATPSAVILLTDPQDPEVDYALGFDGVRDPAGLAPPEGLAVAVAGFRPTWRGYTDRNSPLRYRDVIAVDARDGIWCGLSRLDADRVRWSRITAEDHGIDATWLSHVAADEIGRVYLAAAPVGDEIWKWDTGTVSLWSPVVGPSLSGLTMVRGGVGADLWVSYGSELVRYGASDFSHYTAAEHLLEGTILDVVARPDGTVWAASQSIMDGSAVLERGAVARLQAGAWQRLDLPLDPGIDGGWSVLDLAVDADGALWALVGAETGWRAARLDGDTWTLYDLPERTNQLLVDGSGALWSLGDHQATRFDGAAFEPVAELASDFHRGVTDGAGVTWLLSGDAFNDERGPGLWQAGAPVGEP